jgi:hypothetical protein
LDRRGGKQQADPADEDGISALTPYYFVNAIISLADVIVAVVAAAIFSTHQRNEFFSTENFSNELNLPRRRFYMEQFRHHHGSKSQTHSTPKIKFGYDSFGY